MLVNSRGKKNMVVFEADQKQVQNIPMTTKHIAQYSAYFISHYISLLQELIQFFYEQFQQICTHCTSQQLGPKINVIYHSSSSYIIHM